MTLGQFLTSAAPAAFLVPVAALSFAVGMILIEWYEQKMVLNEVRNRDG